MGGLRERIRFIRVGTLDADDQMMPDVHIFTHSKQPWVILPETDRRVAEFYKYKDIWSAEGLDRLSQLERSAGFTIF